jgi:hypothetical protein
MSRKTIYYLMFLFLAGSSLAAISFDTSAIGHTACLQSNCTGLTNSLNYTLNVGAGGSNRLLVVGAGSAGLKNVSVLNVTYAGTNLTRIVELIGSFQDIQSMWYLTAPATGSNTIVIYYNDSINGTAIGSTYTFISSAISLTGTDQSTPVRSFNSSSSPSSQSASVNITTSSNDWVYDFICAGTSINTPSTSQTVRQAMNYTTSNACDNLAHSTAQPTSSSFAMNWTVNTASADTWGDIVVSIAPFAQNNSPSISGVVNYSLSNTTELINWSTNVSSNSSVNYGVTTALGTFSISTSFTMNNTITLTNLINSTLYYYNVTSCNNIGSCNESGTYNFTTARTYSPAKRMFFTGTNKMVFLGTNKVTFINA